MAMQGTNDGSSGRKRNGNDVGSGYKDKGKRGYIKGNGRTDKAFGERFSRPERYDNKRQKQYVPKFQGKDEDEEEGVRKSRPSRSKENRAGIIIPDKDKTMMRLEKEQKTMKKKQQKKRESNRPQPRIKRANNVNYTRSYANGEYDDYFDI